MREYCCEAMKKAVESDDYISPAVASLPTWDLYFSEGLGDASGIVTINFCPFCGKELK